MVTVRAIIALLATSAACGPAEAPAPSSAPAGLSPSAPASAPVAPELSSSAAGSPLASAVAPSTPDKRVYVVAAMGDSLTDPKSHGGKYLDVLRERCPKSTFLSFGKGGNMVNMMRKRFLRDVYGEGLEVERPKFTHVLILGGLGDVLSNETAFRTAEKITKDISEMVEMSRQRGAKAIVLTLPPWGGMGAFNGERSKITDDVNAWIAAAGKSGAVDGTFDTRPHLSCGEPLKLCKKHSWADGIHWSEEGHRAVGAALHAALFADCQ